MKPVNEITRPGANTTSTDAIHPTHMRGHLLSRLAALFGVLVLGLLYLFLPDKLIFGPSWLLLVIEAILILPFVISLTTQHNLPSRIIRAAALVLLSIITLALAIGIALLVYNLRGEKGTFLLRSA